MTETNYRRDATAQYDRITARLKRRLDQEARAEDMDARYCLCNHSQRAHDRGEWGCAECHCKLFELDVLYEPATSHAQHRTPAPGCLQCEDALAEAREAADELREAEATDG